MSSQRFPGKVLVPFLGRPIIRHILDTVGSVGQIDNIVVLTSDDESDDPLVQYLQTIGCSVFRGPLLDVFGRFQLAARQYSSDWVLRLCADSPLLDPNVLREVVRYAANEKWDVVTTRFDPPFPKGQNVELIRAPALLDVDASELNDHDREHVTPWFYRNRERYQIANAHAVQIDLPGGDFSVDTPSDLVRLKQLLENHQQGVE